MFIMEIMLIHSSFIHLNHTPSLVTPIFYGNNFMRWSRNVYHALIAKNKGGFVNGSLLMPGEKDKKFQKWIRAY